jgi:Raf kinase inhibitor-like YbhB/YbcL family protein
MSGRKQAVTSAVAVVAVLGMFALLSGGCNNDSKLATASQRSGGLWSIRVSSTAFDDGKAIPAKYTADGENISPPISWSGGPGGTKEFAVIVEDPDAPGDMPAVHWLVYKVPTNMTNLPEGASRGANLMQGINYTGQTGWAGPDPKPGKAHRYYFQVLALSDTVNAKPGMTRAEVAQAYKGFVLGKGVLVGTYERKNK